MARLWARFFKNWPICIDTSIEDNNFGSINDYREAEFSYTFLCVQAPRGF